MFSSRSFKLLSLTFKSLIQFKLIFVSDVQYGSSFIILHVSIQLFQHHLLKRLSFLHWVFLALLIYIRWPYVHGLISGLSILFHWSMFLLLCQYHMVCIMLRYVPSIANFLSFYCEHIINFVKWFPCIYWADHTFIDLQMLNHFCICGINPTWSWCMILLMCCWILFASILFRISASIFISDIGL